MATENDELASKFRVGNGTAQVTFDGPPSLPELLSSWLGIIGPFDLTEPLMEHRASIQDFGLACFEQSRPILRFVRRAGGPSTSETSSLLSGQGRRLNGINQVGLLRTLSLIKRHELLVGFEVQLSRLIAFNFALIFQGPQQAWGVRTCGLPSAGEIRVRLGKQPSKRSLNGSILLPVGLLHIRLGDQWTAVFARVNATYAMEMGSIDVRTRFSEATA